MRTTAQAADLRASSRDHCIDLGSSLVSTKRWATVRETLLQCRPRAVTVDVARVEYGGAIGDAAGKASPMLDSSKRVGVGEGWRFCC